MIPLNIDAVTVDWLSEAVGAPVSDFAVQQIGQGVGIMGDIYRVELVYSAGDQAPASVVVKLPSSFEENRAQGVALGMFDAEVKFYRELAGLAPVGLPTIYLAEIVPGTAEFVIVMEDLCELTLVEQSKGMTLAQALAGVRVLADIHAVWWNKVKTPALEWIPTMVGQRIEFVDQLLLQQFPVFKANFAHNLPAGGIELYEKFAGNYLAINTVIAARSPWTLVHQDFRVENMLFEPAGERVVVIDWQGIGRGPGAYDLAYLLGGSMTADLRRANEESLVRAYYDRLVHLGINDYSYEQLWDDYGLAHLMGGLATPMVIGGGMDLSNERGVQLTAAMAARHVSAALDHDGTRRLAAIAAG